MSANQPQLNGAYYGPAIPPSKSYHRPGRGGGGLLGCCCGCIFSLIFKLILSIVIIIGIAIFIFWLIVRPNVVKVHVTDASLTQFNYSGNTLNYNLTLNFSIRNPNKKLGIYYDYIEARALFQDSRFDSDLLPTFYQGHKNTTVLGHVFEGQQVVPLSTDQVSELNKENSKGVYDIRVKLYLKVRFKLGAIKTKKVKPKVTCDLQVPLTSSKGVSSSDIFQTTKCDWSR
ncbi:hypothetical protein HN51_040823 [Arachis hypogaea]|uniref:Late embryogenesis abundant protein LEA-2 subgroup domain-containing protein n=1 Tax=Arachis hypogaea TaxID=3818 RepID=A0A444YQ59_ARAHY|nr:NDR1/HIN1-like protein 3 [Arachis ipaensis]XP_025658086.1 NDR1/HIN1-like protein 3 [Arachis hypogaea]QHN86489.1 uncharacterized protein DS421_16g546740 [Arachis hypogaea]RYR04009.1 hypothetical protein Ahy_B06g083510 [Arachis hypogaea]